MPRSREEDFYRTPVPWNCWGHEINNSGRPFLGHHYWIHILSDLCQGVQKKIFKEKCKFYIFNSKTISPLGGWPWVGGRSQNLQFFISFPYRCYIPNLVKIDSVFLGKKMLTDDAQCQPIPKGHLSNSDDLKRRLLNNKCIKTIWPFWPCPKGHVIYNFGRGLSGLHYYAFSLSSTC